MICRAMAHFYFQLHECGTLIADDEGRELPDLAAAHAAAIAEARQVMSSEVLDGRLCLSCCMVIEDARHREVSRVPFREALALTGL